MAKRSLIQNGILTVPLFHGTSTRFQSSITEYGLGGRNVVEELGIRSAARLLIQLAADFAGQDDWIGDIDACQRIAATSSASSQFQEHSRSITHTFKTR